MGGSCEGLLTSIVALGTMEKRKLVYTSCGVGCVVTSVALDWKPKSKLSDRGFLSTYYQNMHSFINSSF